MGKRGTAQAVSSELPLGRGTFGKVLFSPNYFPTDMVVSPGYRSVLGCLALVLSYFQGWVDLLVASA